MNSQSHRDAIKLGFDVSSAAGRRPRGIASYIKALLPALTRSAPWIEPVLFLRDERWLRKSAIADLLPSAERRWLIEPVKTPLADIDVFHGMGTRLPRANHLPRSFTLHDLRGFDLGANSAASSTEKRATRKGRTIRAANRILCISEHCRARLLHHFPDTKEEATQVIHHGVDHGRFFPRDRSESEEALKEIGIKPPFLLQLGSFFPHKNLSLSIESFARSRARKEGLSLVLAGGGGDTTELKSRCDQLGVSEDVTWVEELSEASLPLILSGAGALLFPSRYEGFGLPVLEAMATGIPGVSSNCASLTEVAGGIWKTCDPDDVEGFSAAIDEVVFDSEERAARVSAGLAHASLFTWDRCAAQTAEFLSSLPVTV